MKQIQEDKIISEFLNSLGPWREFVVIGGGFALFIYKLFADPVIGVKPNTVHLIIRSSPS